MVWNPFSDLKLSDCPKIEDFSVESYLCSEKKEPKVGIERDGKVLRITLPADLSLVIEGELSVLTKSGLIAIDSINSKVWINSRMAETIRDDPESIEYRKSIESSEENDHQPGHSCLENLEVHIANLESRIQFLEAQLALRMPS